MKIKYLLDPIVNMQLTLILLDMRHSNIYKLVEKQGGGI